jgi:RNase P subunit RPR2
MDVLTRCRKCRKVFPVGMQVDSQSAFEQGRRGFSVVVSCPNCAARETYGERDIYLGPEKN